MHLVVPKIKITSKIDLKHLLPKIGINDIFTTKAVTWNTTKTSTILEVSRASAKFLSYPPQSSLKNNFLYISSSSSLCGFMGFRVLSSFVH